jgi:hypothetical protein
MKITKDKQTKRAQNNLRLSLIINVIAPLLLYVLLRHFHVSNFASLAWSAAIPTVDTFRVWIVQRRIDWIGAFSVAEFAVQLLLTALIGGTLILKINDAFVTGPLGLAFIVSALMNRPLLIPIRQAIISSVSGSQAKHLATRTPSLRQMNMVSIILGALLVLHSIAIVTLALTLPTTKFLLVSKVITWGGVVAAFLLVRFGRSRIAKARNGQVVKNV